MKTIAFFVCTCACASALHEPTPVRALAPHRGSGNAAELVRAADTAWARRGDPGQAEVAQGLYLDAAAADEHRIDALIGAMRAVAFRLEHETGGARDKLAELAVQVGQWCVRRAPTEPACAYRLAIAVGQQARERPSTGHDALNVMLELLHRTIRDAPGLDDGGAHRVLALVLLRAPAWPAGPGDPDAALDEARASVTIESESAANQLVLAEALAATDRIGPSRAAYEKALVLAIAARSHGDPEAATWIADARAGLGH